MNRLPRLDPIGRDTLWKRVHSALKSALLAGRFFPGQRIILREIADELGTSLTPVRDAVNHLIAENFLERGGVGQGGGATVPLLDADQFNQLMIVRASLEPVAASIAANLATTEQIDAIQTSLDEMKRSVMENRHGDYLDAHYRFHFSIYAVCRMPIVQQLIDSAWLRCGPTLTLALPQHIPSLKRYDFHVTALDALRHRQGERAAAAIRADIESARNDIFAMLDRVNLSYP